MRRPIALGLLGLAVLAGCSGRTTGATDISVVVSRFEFSAKANLNAIGSCSESCTFFVRWRQVGDSDWTNGPSHAVGAVGRTRWHETVDGLTPFLKYEYQACGKEDSWSGVVCVGPDGTSNTTQKFVTNGPGSGDWPQFGFDYAHTGFNPTEITIDTGNVSSLTQAWFGTVRDATSPSVVNGVVYVGGRRLRSGTGLVAAYHATCRIDGERCRQRLWTADVGTGVDGSTPAVAFNRLYVGSEDGKLYALNPADGSRIWTGQTGGPISESPTAGPGLIYVGSKDGSVYAFLSSCGTGGATCTPVWKTPTFGAATSPAIDPLPGDSGGRVFAGSADHNLYAFHEREGGIIWTGATGGAIRFSPAVSNGVVYVGSDDGKLYAFPADCPAQLGKCPVYWSAATGGPISSSPAFDDVATPQTVYVGSSDGKLYAYSASCYPCAGGGELQWTGATGGAITSTPTVANGVVYVGSADGKLYAFRAAGCGAATCQPLFTGTTGGHPSSAAVASGEVYLGDDTGVRAFSLP